MSGRVDVVVSAAWADLSRARLQKLIAAGAVEVNGSPVRKSALVEPGDRVVVSIPRMAPESSPVPFTVPVLYEDDEVVAVDKPPGLTVHGGPGERRATVASWFEARYPGLVAAFTSGRPGIVHRLDKDTTGVLVLAKTPAVQAVLGRAFETRQAKKTYVAICDGAPQHPRGVVDANLGRDPGDRTRMAVVRRGRGARTVYEVIATADGKSVIEARPESGRTHQIRVHLAAIGAPVHGDRVYGRASEGRQSLHAWRLQLPHPAGGVLEVTAPLPDDLRLVISALGLADEAVRYYEPAPPRRLPAEEASDPS